MSDRTLSEEILNARLQKEADRLGVPVDEARSHVLRLGLDAAKERREREVRTKDTEVDVLLVTATITEHRELRGAVCSLGLPFEKRQGRLGTYYHIGRLGDDRVASIQVEMGPFGSQGSAAKCIQARAETRATMVILLGTAFGVNRVQQSVGDVLVSESVFLYDDRRAVDVAGTSRYGATFEVIGGYLDAVTSDRWALARRIRAFSGRGYVLEYPFARRPASAAWVERFRRVARDYARAGEAERIIVGTILSGGALIESERFLDDLLADIPAMEPPIVGGEMEAVGAISASTPGDAYEPGWIVVKGIVDFAEASSRADIEINRKRAARASARAVLRVLSSPRGSV